MSVSFPQIRTMAVLSMVGMMLAGCAGGGVNLPGIGRDSANSAANSDVRSTAQDVSGAGTIVDDTTKIILSNPKKLSGYCPRVSILGETNIYEALSKKPTGSNAAQNVVHQATITQTARECTTLGAEMFIKVGVAGRVLAGPKASEASKAILPLRIVVKQRDDVLYTKLHKIPVNLTPPALSALFAKVDEGIAIPTPAEKNVQILVGFDAAGL